MGSFLIAALISIVLILICTMAFYEVLAHVWVHLPKFDGHPRKQILLTIVATFLGHTICVWIFALSYYALYSWTDYGTLTGATGRGFIDYLYFSSVSYSSLGLGDVTPTGDLQLLVSVESILGLILIGWTVTFTYLVTEQYLFHRRKPKKD